jgi:ABC-type Fe3+-hydroxamate transport system substrate-binding protein
MRIASVLLALAATGFLTACTSEEACTNEDATKKAADLSAKLQEVATADPAKLAELAPKVQELAAQAAGTGDDLQAACKAMDEMMAELSK